MRSLLQRHAFSGTPFYNMFLTTTAAILFLSYRNVRPAGLCLCYSAPGPEPQQDYCQSVSENAFRKIYFPFSDTLCLQSGFRLHPVTVPKTDIRSLPGILLPPSQPLIRTQAHSLHSGRPGIPGRNHAGLHTLLPAFRLMSQ